MNDEWRTPPYLIEEVADTLGKYFVFDAACTKENAVVFQDKHYPEYDLLKVDWLDYVKDTNTQMVWCNPPYSRGNIDKFVAKGGQEFRDYGIWSVFLVRADTSADWFQKARKYDYASIYFLPRRVRFVGASASYNFPSCLMIFDGCREMDYWDYKV